MAVSDKEKYAKDLPSTRSPLKIKASPDSVGPASSPKDCCNLPARLLPAHGGVPTV